MDLLGLGFLEGLCYLVDLEDQDLCYLGGLCYLVVLKYLEVLGCLEGLEDRDL